MKAHPRATYTSFGMATVCFILGIVVGVTIGWYVLPETKKPLSDLGARSDAATRSEPIVTIGQANPQDVVQDGYGSLSSTWEVTTRQDVIQGIITSIDTNGGIKNGFVYRSHIKMRIGSMGETSYYFNDADRRWCMNRKTGAPNGRVPGNRSVPAVTHRHPQVRHLV